MLVSDVISRVRKIAGDEDSIQFSDTDVIQWINDAAKEVASDNQLLQKSASQTSVLGQTDYALPADILKLHSVKYDGAKLRMVNMQEFDELIGDTDGTDQGTPSVGLVWAGVLQLFPKPDNSTKLIRVDYTRTPTAVGASGDSIDLPTMYQRRLVDYCLAMIAEQDDDQNRYMMKMQEFRTGVQTLKDQGETQEDLYPFISVASRDMGEGYFYSD